MNLKTIAILVPGEMGHAVGRALRDHGHKVITCLEGRGDQTRARSAQAGLRDVHCLADLVAEADLIMSILPPAAALNQAKAVAKAIKAQTKVPIYVDCNAISPEKSIAVGHAINEAGAQFIDGGIVGLPPGLGGSEPRFYVSGSDFSAMKALNGKGIKVIGVGPDVGQASAVKMTYAGLTKGTWTLQTAVLLAAEQLGVTDVLLSEFDNSQNPALTSMRATIPFIPADSARWVGEMEEISRTFSNAGVTSHFHDGALEIFQLLEQTPLAAETRADMDRTRTLEEALAIYTKQLLGRKKLLPQRCPLP